MDTIEKDVKTIAKGLERDLKSKKAKSRDLIMIALTRAYYKGISMGKAIAGGPIYHATPRGACKTLNKNLH